MLNPILVHISTTIFIGQAVKNGIILMGHQPLKSDVSVATDLSANVQNASIKCQPWGEKHQQIGSNFRLHFAALHMIGKGQNQAPESIGCTVSSPRNGMASPRHDSLTPQQMISEKEEDIVLQENHLPNITTKSMSLSDRLKLARTAHENRDAFYILSSA